MQAEHTCRCSGRCLCPWCWTGCQCGWGCLSVQLCHWSPGHEGWIWKNRKEKKNCSAKSSAAGAFIYYLKLRWTTWPVGKLQMAGNGNGLNTAWTSVSLKSSIVMSVNWKQHNHALHRLVCDHLKAQNTKGMREAKISILVSPDFFGRSTAAAV